MNPVHHIEWSRNNWQRKKNRSEHKIKKKKENKGFQYLFSNCTSFRSKQTMKTTFVEKITECKHTELQLLTKAAELQTKTGLI